MRARDGRGCQDRPQGWERSLQPVANYFVVKGIEVTASDAGNVRHASEGTDHQGDLAFALGLAVTVAERLTGRRQRAVTLSQGRQERERPVGTRRYDNAARRRIEELREQRERRWADTVRFNLTPGWRG